MSTYDTISGYLLQMMDANTEEIFNNAYFQAKTQLRDRTNHNERHEEALDQFANNRIINRTTISIIVSPD